MIDLSSIFTDEVKSVLRLFAVVTGLLHVLVSLVLSRWIMNAHNTVSTPYGRFIVFVSVLHILLLAAILFFIILY